MNTKRIPVDVLRIGHRFIPEGRKRPVEIINLSDYRGATIDVYAESPNGASAHILNRYDTVEIVADEVA